MQTVHLKTTKEDVVLGDQKVTIELSTQELLKTVINHTPEGGYTASEMLMRIKLLDKVEYAEKNNENLIQFEDTQYEHLSKLVKQTKWGVVSRTILEFIESFNK